MNQTTHLSVKRQMCLLMNGASASTPRWHDGAVVTETGVARGPRRRPEEVRRLLVEAAERVVVRKGMSANAQEIAIEAGVHRSVLYRHFTGAQELIQLAALGPFREFLGRIQLMTARADEAEPTPLWDLMVGFLGDLMDILSDHRDFLMMAMSEASPLEESDRDELRRHLDDVLDEIAELAARAGATRQLDIEHVRINTRLAIAMNVGVASFGRWLLPDPGPTAPREILIEQMASMLLYGVRQVSDAEKQLDRRSPGRR
ncbi:MAG: TetR/AcrR family transcriptional regulator [Mycobacterium sp.]|nr:MAG: TetR/AcrR family transcriptional regulator [Mycobacterium sp.]